VGDVGSLYKTQKSSSHIPGNTPALDLHGHTKDEALATLDENLNGWVETAMQGSYPFVIQVKIICGCGSQTLSEVVEKWIKSKSNVSNAPKKR
jgi:DNA-nicking Smr family endonuclease